MPRVRVGIQLRPQHGTWAQIEEAALRADELGIDFISTWDHFFPLSGPADGPHFEGWTTLAVLAGKTKHAQLTHLVLSVGYRNPALLSDMAKTLDHATGGRFVLGLGAGWFARDYNEYGFEFGTPGKRLRLLERGVEVIKDRWSRDVPPPLKGTVPILIGGGGERVTLRIVARHADIWHAFGASPTWSAKNRVLDDWCAKLGRDPASIERSAAYRDDEEDAEDLVKAGARLLVHDLDPPYSVKRMEKLLAWRDRQRA